MKRKCSMCGAYKEETEFRYMKNQTDITVIAKTVRNYTTKNIREFTEKGKWLIAIK